jgi:putative SOS response-associated peptidase YedK
MCYGVKARTEMALRIAKSRGNKGAAEKLARLLAPPLEGDGPSEGLTDLHFGNAFSHPRLVVYTDAAPHEPQLSIWGLIPSWVKDDGKRKQLWNQTLNARGETIFEKPAFRASAREKRCLVHVEGFYEHHHLGKRTYPYFIRLKHRPHFALAGLWERWKDPATGEAHHTFSIVTCAGNDLMTRIHNKPNAMGSASKETGRMPVILTEAEEDLWLMPIRSDADQRVIQGLIKPYPADAMTAHPVRHLLGKDGIGNHPAASAPFNYPELALADPLHP